MKTCIVVSHEYKKRAFLKKALLHYLQKVVKTGELCRVCSKFRTSVFFIYLDFMNTTPF